MYFDYTIDKYENMDIAFNKTVYTYWHDDKNPIINHNIEMWRRNIDPSWRIVFINQNSLSNYVGVDFLRKYKDLDHTRLSDFLRLELLKNKGGVWMDSGIIVYNGKFLDDYLDVLMGNPKYEVCLYEYKERTVEENKPYLENWFIMAKPYSKFVNGLYNEFDKAKSMGFANYKRDVIVPRNFSLDRTIGRDGDGTYLLQHAIVHYLFDIGAIHTDNICIRQADESMFKLQIMHGWDDKKVVDTIMSTPNMYEKYGMYAIKVTGRTRSFITDIDGYKNL